MSENKLTIKEVAPYLPYSPRCQWNELTYTVSGLVGNLVSFEEYKGDEYLDDIKPLLRPLSDLTKEITVNGETFVPVEYFEIGEEVEGTEFDHGNIKLIKTLTIMADYDVVHDVAWLPFGVVQKLYEWHFDVFGLLSKNLAINLNTIEPKTP